MSIFQCGLLSAPSLGEDRDQERSPMGWGCGDAHGSGTARGPPAAGLQLAPGPGILRGAGPGRAGGGCGTHGLGKWELLSMRGGGFGHRCAGFGC